MTKETKKMKLHRAVILLSICGLHTEQGGRVFQQAPVSTLPSLSTSGHSFFPALYLVQSRKSAKVLHGTWIASYIRMAFYIYLEYALCLLKKD